MNFITKAFNHLKDRNINHQELKNAKRTLFNKSGVYFKKDIDLVTNHYQAKITKIYSNDIHNSKPIIYYIEGEKIKITQVNLKNNLKDITKILAFLKNNTKSDANKIDYLANNFSKRALNVLKDTLDTDIHTQLKPQEYNHLGIVHSIFGNDRTKVSRTQNLIKKAIDSKENDISPPIIASPTQDSMQSRILQQSFSNGNGSSNYSKLASVVLEINNMVLNSNDINENNARSEISSSSSESPEKIRSILGSVFVKVSNKKKSDISSMSSEGKIKFNRINNQQRELVEI